MVSVIQVRSTLELRDVLRELQGKYLVQDWYKMELLNLLKELPKSGDDDIEQIDVLKAELYEHGRLQDNLNIKDKNKFAGRGG
ncbi:hypothetical protein Tco_1321593 [Tanacetum coccineum]